MTTYGQRVIITGLLRDSTGRVLIICPTDDLPDINQTVWWLPGAELPPREHPVAFLRRAIHTQLGLDVQPRGLRLTTHRLAVIGEDQPEFVLLFDCGQFDATALRDQVRLGNGIELWDWATLAQARQRLDPDEAERVGRVLPSRPGFGGYLEQTRHHHDYAGEVDAAHDAPGRHAARTGS